MLIMIPVLAAAVYVGSQESVTNSVADGADVVQSDDVVVADGGRLLKTGGGTWTIPQAVIGQSAPLPLTVLDGGVSIPEGGTSPSEVPPVLNKALVWLSAKDAQATHFAKDGDNLQRWYDVRETDPSAPTYLSAIATNCAQATVLTYPTLTVKDGFEAVYFGGKGSGVGMAFARPEDAAHVAYSGVYHIFYVHGWYEAGIQAVAGSLSARGFPFMYNVSQSTMAGVAYADAGRAWAPTARGRAFVDGVRFDYYRTSPTAGTFHLFDFGTPVKQVDAVVAGLFGAWGAKTYWGGDYLSEVVCFTNELTEVERLQVSAYLTRKWFGNKARSWAVELAEKGRYEVDCSSGAVAITNSLLTGDGTLVKSGAGALIYREGDVLGQKSFTGTLALSEEEAAKSSAVIGSINSKVAFRAQAGKAYDVGYEDGAVRATMTAQADATRLVKTGSADFALSAVPPGVKKISVEEGTLELYSARTNTLVQDEAPFIVPLIDPGFENYETDEAWATLASNGGQFVIPTRSGWSDLNYVNNSGNACGWRRISNQTWLVRPRTWTQRAAYNLTHDPRNGDVVAMIAQNGTLMTPVNIPKPGYYELSFDLCGRETVAYLGAYVDCYLGMSTSTTKYADFGKFYFYEYGYRRVRKIVSVDQTGDMELRIHCCDLADGSLGAVVDNFQLRYVPAWERLAERGVWKIPQGDVEYDQDLIKGVNRDPVTTVPPALSSWQFDQGAGRVAIVCAATTNASGIAGIEYDASRGADGGFRQLLLCGGACAATVTATPPPATYHLRADISRYYSGRGTLAAYAKIGTAAEVALGAITVSNAVMAAYTWPMEFTVVGTQTVAIRLATTDANGVFVDDLRLVDAAYDEGEELVENGGFENPARHPDSDNSNWAHGWEIARGSRSGTTQVQPYSYLPNIFTPDAVDGRYFLYLERGDKVMREVTFPAAGTYRLSFYRAATQRGIEAGVDGWYHSQAVKVWLAQGGATNELGLVQASYSTTFEQFLWLFKVAAPGTYTLGFEGAEDVAQNPNVAIDAVSIRPVNDRLSAAVDAAIPEDATIEIKNGARLRVSFDGVKKVARLRINGRSVWGRVDVKDHPEALSGFGVFEVGPMPGFVVNIR